MLLEQALVLTGTRDVPVTYDVRSGLWLVLERTRYYTPTSFFDIEAGFTSDLASIPRIAWPVIAPHELSIIAALGHDLLYRRGGRVPGWRWTRAQADAEFYFRMISEGVPEWKARVAYTAVRQFGGGSWKG